jgi:hypothetical protein
MLILLVCLSASNESRPATSEKTLFSGEKTRAARTITKEIEERKRETAKKAGKMRFF